MSPLRSVLESFADGATSRRALVETTGLSYDVVDGVVAHLTRVGRLHELPTASGCTSSGCGACPFSGGSAAPCAGARQLSR